MAIFNLISHFQKEKPLIRIGYLIQIGLYFVIIFTTFSDFKELSNAPFLNFLRIKGPANAFAFPGGIICITNKMLETLTSEAEVISILGHEIGHIERGHLFDTVRGQLLSRKIQEISLASYVIDTIQMFSKFTFSKTQEDEADDYAFRMLLEKEYNPFALSSAFAKLLQHKSQRETDFFKDIFLSHPHTELRRDKFRSLAENWLVNHPTKKQYIGRKNLKEKKSRYDVLYSEEYECSINLKNDGLNL